MDFIIVLRPFLSLGSWVTTEFVYLKLYLNYFPKVPHKVF